jgi:hypothetical protein
VTNGERSHHDVDGDKPQAETKQSAILKSEAASGLEKELREMEHRQYLQFQEKMLKKDAQMVELDQVSCLCHV